MDCLWRAGAGLQAWPKLPEQGHFGTGNHEKADICGLFWFLNEKNRVKCG
jgi:hypothetical protein